MSTDNPTDRPAQDQQLPEKMVDVLGKPEDRATWVFCGAFPLKEISAGRRACRYGWRNRGYPLFFREKLVPEETDGGWAMLAVGKSDGEHPSLFLEREYADEFGSGEPFDSIEDMLAEDWYLELKC